MTDRIPTDSPASLAALSRRRAIGVFAMGCLATPALLRSAVAEAKKSGKPLFTVERVNAKIPKPGTEGYKRVLGKMRDDPLGWVRFHFHLPEPMDNKANQVDPTTLEQISEALEQAMAKELPVVLTHTAAQEPFTLVPEFAGGQLELRARG